MSFIRWSLTGDMEWHLGQLSALLGAGCGRRWLMWILHGLRMLTVFNDELQQFGVGIVVVGTWGYKHGNNWKIFTEPSFVFYRTWSFQRDEWLLATPIGAQMMQLCSVSSDSLVHLVGQKAASSKFTGVNRSGRRRQPRVLSFFSVPRKASCFKVPNFLKAFSGKILSNNLYLIRRDEYPFCFTPSTPSNCPARHASKNQMKNYKGTHCFAKAE